VVIGPFTPGYVADQKLADQLAELGVILLMFGVGLHFSLKDLLSVKAIAVPGAVAQIAVATVLGMGLAWMLGWSMGAGVVFGLALSVASTVVLLKALQDRRLVENERGRIAVGWLIVEDIAMVAALVLIPPMATLLGGKSPESGTDWLATSLGVTSVSGTLLLTAAKVATFITLMLVVGRRLIPWLLHHTAHSGSRELFRLAVLAIALGLAFGSAELFGVSFALGAFFAGMVMAESTLSTQAARETLPLRDAFAVLFFVSVGMLFNPAILVDKPLAVLATFLTIVIGKSLAAYLIVRAFGYSRSVALTISVSLAQIGEFSFILMVLGLQLEIVPAGARDLVVAGAMFSILVNPFLFLALDRISKRIEDDKETADAEALVNAPAPKERIEKPTLLRDHGILVGHGRVGRLIRAEMEKQGVSLLVIEEDDDALGVLRAMGIEHFRGTAGEEPVLQKINLKGARWLISAIPDAFEAGNLVERARAVNPGIRIIARAHTPEAAAYIKQHGADEVIMGEDEIAHAMVRAVTGSIAP
jgi:CPA2 family monovalent cation:H+ antiporter-2